VRWSKSGSITNSSNQELMLTDILHAFAQNPIPPAYDPAWRFPASHASGDLWVTQNEGIHTVGHADDSFHFDNEKPAHRALVARSNSPATSSPMPNGSPSCKTAATRARRCG